MTKLPELPEPEHDYITRPGFTAGQERGLLQLALAGFEAEIDTLRHGLRLANERYEDAIAKREPLSDEKLIELWIESGGTMGGPHEFGRAIEREHGIK